MLLLAATLPFHAFLGIAIMSVADSGDGLIAASHYLPLHGLQGSVFQQQVGGGALWASGDLVGRAFPRGGAHAVDAGQRARGGAGRSPVGPDGRVLDRTLTLS